MVSLSLLKDSFRWSIASPSFPSVKDDMNPPAKPSLMAFKMSRTLSIPFRKASLFCQSSTTRAVASAKAAVIIATTGLMPAKIALINPPFVEMVSNAVSNAVLISHAANPAATPAIIGRSFSILPLISSTVLPT